MARLRISCAAERDLDDIWLDIAQRSGSETVADGVIGSIIGLFPLFAKHPRAGKRRDEFPGGVGSFAVEKYVIYYQLRGGGTVVILRVLHGMRDPQALRQSGEE